MWGNLGKVLIVTSLNKRCVCSIAQVLALDLGAYDLDGTLLTCLSVHAFALCNA